MEIQILKIKPINTQNDIGLIAVGDILLNFGEGNFIQIRDFRICNNGGKIDVFCPGLRFRSQQKGKPVYSKLISLPPHIMEQVKVSLKDAYRIEVGTSGREEKDSGTGTEAN